ncbi:MAG TPA: membrane protein insertion efficiency factor YidD [Methylomirabilota bacterium]
MTPGTRLVLGVLTGYRFVVSPVLPPACRFAPTCSEYARQAVEWHGVVRGLWLALMRLGRCHPFHPGGYDPPPPSPRNV